MTVTLDDLRGPGVALFATFLVVLATMLAVWASGWLGQRLTEIWKRRLGPKL